MCEYEEEEEEEEEYRSVHFYRKLTDNYVLYYHDFNNHSDKFIFYPKLMDQVKNYTLTNYVHDNLLLGGDHQLSQ